MSIAEQYIPNSTPFYEQLGNLAASGQLEETHDSSNELEKALRLSGMLQTTLDLNKIVEIFAHEVGKLVPFDHIEYSRKETGLSIGFGEASKHSSVYRLVVAGETLGQLLFSRPRKFNHDETSLIEKLLCGFIYPLRNALMYQNAIEAAHKDPLTGVNNRASMDSTIIRELDLARRHNASLSLLALDIDHFKKVNDTYGHSMGDCVIKAVAEAATAAIRGSDMVFRFGGEEFVILLSNTDPDGAALLAERLRQRIEDTVIICDGTHVSATVSIGITCMKSEDTPEKLFSRADSALYQAKSSGRNCCRLQA